MYTILYPEVESKLRAYQVTLPAQDQASIVEHQGVSIPVTPAPALLQAASVAPDPTTAGGARRVAHVQSTPGAPWPSRVWQMLSTISIKVGTR